MARETIERPRRATPRATRRASQPRARKFSPVWLTLAALAVVALIVGAVFLMSSRGGNGGALATLQTPDFHALAFSPSNPQVAFFGHHNGILRTDDGGRTWQPLVDRPNFDAMGLAVSHADPQHIFLAGHNIFQVSTDGGRTWHPVTHNLPGTDIHGFAMNPDDAGRLYAFVVGQGLFQSTDGATTWQRLAGQVPHDVMALAAAGGTPEVLYAGSLSGGVLRSENGGQTWLPAGNAPDLGRTAALAVDPANYQVVYAGTDTGLYKSSDSGASWLRLPFPGPNAVALALSPSQPELILAIAVKDGQGLVYRSTDGGTTWGSGR